MTSTTEAKTRIRRETPARYRGVPLVIEIRSHTIAIREKGRRTAYEVSYDQIFTLGARNAANARAAEKRARRKEREA